MILILWMLFNKTNDFKIILSKNLEDRKFVIDAHIIKVMKLSKKCASEEILIQLREKVNFQLDV